MSILKIIKKFSFSDRMCEFKVLPVEILSMILNHPDTNHSLYIQLR
jgi:hypothetical protein